MRRHHTGSGRRLVIPLDWSATHAVVMTDTYESSVTITSPGSATRVFNDSTGSTDTTPGSSVYTGVASLVLVSDPQLVQVVEQAAPTTLFQLLLPFEVATVLTGFIVHVDDSPDPMLDGKDLNVVGTFRGDRRFARVFNVVLDA